MSQATNTGVWLRRPRDSKPGCTRGCGRVATVVSGARPLCSSCYTRERARLVRRVA